MGTYYSDGSFGNIKMILYYFTILIVVVTVNSSRSSEAEQGRGYEVIVYNTSSCVVQQPWFQANVTVYTNRGRRLLRGTGFAQREIKNVRFRIRMYYLGDTITLKVFETKNQNCRNAIVRLTLTTMGLRYDSKKCSMNPGTWEFSDLDLDKIIHMLVPATGHGLMQGRWEMYTPSVPLMCLDIYSQFVPRQDTIAKT